MSYESKGNGFGHEAIELMIVYLWLLGKAMEDDFAADEEGEDGDEHQGIEKGHGDREYQAEEDGIQLDCIVELPVEFIVQDTLLGLAVSLCH